MSRRAAHARLAARNARLLDEAGLPPAPQHPRSRTLVPFSTNAHIERDSSTIERKAVPEDVGCTITKLDWMHNIRTTVTSRANSGSKLQHAQIGDGTLATHVRRAPQL